MASFISVISLASSLVGQHAMSAIMYDDRQAMIVSNVRTISKKIKPGEQFVYEFDYDKRAECYPPKGAGEVTYRIWFEDAGAFERFHVVDPATISYADPAMHHRTTTVTIPPLLPGHYMMQWRVYFVCQGASKPQSWDGALMPFDVVP